MYFAGLSAVALVISCASAYENSSPFFLYSTSNLNIPSIQDLSSAFSVQSAISKPLSQCLTKNYIVVSQPGVSADDFSNSRNTPLLKDRLNKSGKDQTSITVRDVVDTIAVQDIDRILKDTCQITNVQNLDASTDLIPELDDSNKSNALVHIQFPALQQDLAADDRHVVLQHHDLYLSTVIDNYFGGEDYTMIYTTSSIHAASASQHISEGKEYISDMAHQELRRDLGASIARSNNGSSSNQTMIDGPLFDKYQFLSPGIFMGLFVGIVLLAILYVGISALSSLQVTYGAFDKEQGQLAAKKQQ